MRFGGL